MTLTLADAAVIERMAKQMFHCVNQHPFANWATCGADVRAAFRRLARAAYPVARKDIKAMLTLDVAAMIATTAPPPEPPTRRWWQIWR